MTRRAELFRPFAGRLWRICAAGADPLAIVASPEGRFHHDGQPALYASLSLEGAGVALVNYVTPDDPPRLAWPLDLAVTALADLRCARVCAGLGIDPDDLVARWAMDRSAGRPARSWRASDRLRDLGAAGAIYPSRKSPEHAHLVLFAATGLRRAGPPRLWRAPKP
ncbi:RES family NAD+ phosphorylase [Limimaricola sp.]|uniref:RES family NAD+ phosphorylase n=1 Tax=Limimaricola sp. TaxID=2211665 RepID=UPI00405A22D8